MKLLLTSSGFMGTSLERDFGELTGNHTNLNVAIIPTASDPIEWILDNESDEIDNYVAKLCMDKIEQHRKWLDTYAGEWKNRGHRVVIADLKEDPRELRQKIESADIIDVIGGDVNWLLDWSKKSELDTYLKDVLNNGAIYVGTSAGSGLITPDIGLTWWEPDWKDDHIGLGIVDFIVVPHQRESDDRTNIKNLKNRRDYLQTLINFPWKIHLLKDGQAIRFDGDTIEHVGKGEKRWV